MIEFDSNPFEVRLLNPIVSSPLPSIESDWRWLKYVVLFFSFIIFRKIYLDFYSKKIEEDKGDRNILQMY
jgi:hypothetical protein